LLTFPTFADEAALLGQLATGTPAERDAARQSLLVTATPAAIPQLAVQLASPETFDTACFLLEAMRLPEADATLRATLSTTTGREQAGLLDALTRRADPAAEKTAIALISQPEPVHSAALHYLGHIATPAARAALAAAPADAASADATLASAETLASRKESKQAVALYLQLYRSSQPDHLRLAAFAGLVRTDTANTAAWLTEGLTHTSQVWRGTAARLAAQLPEKALVKQGDGLMKSLPAAGRLALANAIVAAKKSAGAPLLRAALENEADTPTRLVAAAGIGDLGTAADAPALIALLGHADAALADAARMSLIKLVDPKTDARLVRALGKRADDAQARSRLISVVTFRKSKGAAPKLAPYLADDDPSVRTAAFQALTELASESQLPELFAAACKATDAKEKRAADKALSALARHYPTAATGAIAAALPSANPEARRAFLQALGIAGSPAGLPLVQAALKDPNTDVADEALRTLSGWKGLPAAPLLFDQAKTHPKNSLRVLSLRGYIRLIEKEPDMAARAAMLKQAEALITRPEERLLATAAWRTVPTPESAALLQQRLADAALKGEALKSLKVIALHTPVNLPDAAPGSLLTPLTFVPHRIGACRSEACAVADFNGDGKLDIVAGSFLYLAPDWKPVKIRDVSTTVTDDGKGYADDFCNLVIDVNKDGKPDIVSGGWFNKTSFWFENTCGKSGLWPEHVIDPLGNHETGTLEDVDGDGKALEFVPQSHITVWYEAGKGTNGAPTLVRHTVSEKRNKLGAGAGDLNGDGRPDIIRPDVWFEAPKDIRSGTWTEHAIALGGTNGTSDHTSNIIVVDMNKDGLNDILVSSAHKFGIFWYEQQRGADGVISWKQHTIDDTWSQAHYLAFADIDKDGNKEIISGKRFMAHNGGDPDEFGTQCVFYYRFTPGPNPAFRKHVITYDEGISAGLNIEAVDIDNDGDLDLVTTGKWGGPALFENRMTEQLSDEERLADAKMKVLPSEPVRGDNLALASRGAKAASDSELEGSKGCTAKLNDGAPFSHTAQTRWHSALTPLPHWAEVTFAKPAKVGRVIARFADPAGYAAQFDIQVKKGAEYKTVFKTDSNREAQAVNITFAPVETDTVRFVFRKNANPAYPNAAQLGELEVYAQ
jgi:HEAT repeat protein